jgi:hypothetical protein
MDDRNDHQGKPTDEIFYSECPYTINLSFLKFSPAIERSIDSLIDSDCPVLLTF